MKKEECDHIIGYGRRHDDHDDGNLISQSVLDSWEILLEDGEDYGSYSISIEFSFCPACGYKLEE